MSHEPHGDSDADFEVARRAVELGWLTREQVEVALLEVELVPSSRLLSHLPLTPDQIRRIGGPAPALPPEIVQAAGDPSRHVAQYILSDHQWTGGMGKVVKAWDTRLSRWVALKFMRKLGDTRLQASFEEEARLAAGLAHPNIAAIYEIGEHEGAPFIAMQFIDGRTLAEARRGLKPREAARILRDAAQAVSFAHERGIIHRDLKPSNVMLDGTGHVFVMDFGLAAHTQVPVAPRGPSAVTGTPEYLSPEQARAEDSDERTDVHGLGATLYDALTGLPPNSGKTPQDVVFQMAKADRPRPRALNRQIESDLETIVLKCLESDRERRYPMAREVADDLDRFLNRDPIAAHRPNVIYRLRMKLAKLKMAVAAAITALLLAGVLGWWLLVGSRETEHARLYADAMNLWADVLRSAGAGGDPEGIPKRARKAREAFDQAIQLREEAKALWMKGKCLVLEGDDERALEALERAHQLDPRFDEARIELAKTLLLKYQDSRGLPPYYTYPTAPSGFRFEILDLPPESAQQRLCRERGENLLKESQAADAHMSLLKGLLLMGRGVHAEAAKELAAYSKVERWDVHALCLQGFCSFFADDLPGALAAMDQALGRVPHANCFKWRGYVKASLGRCDDAIADFDKAIKLDPKSSQTFCRRGSAKAAKGLHVEALADFDKAIELDPASSAPYAFRGISKTALGSPEEAVVEFTRAIELAPNHPEFWSGRGMARAAKGHLKEAIADYTQAISLRPQASIPFYNRGNASKAMGQHDAAIRDYTEAIRLNSKYTEAYINRGVAMASKGFLDVAIADFDKAILLEPGKAEAFLNRGRAKSSQGRFDEAIDDYTQAIKANPKYAPAYVARGNARSEKGQREYAISDFDKAIELDPKLWGAYFNRGNAMAARGNLDVAISDFTQAIFLNPKYAESYSNRGNARVRKGFIDDAIRDWLRALEVAPKGWPYRAVVQEHIRTRGAGVLYDEAGRLHESKKYREAIEKFKAVLSSLPTAEQSLGSAYNIACGYALLGEKASALEWLEKAVELGWKDVGHFEKDADLDSLRGEERYKKLVDGLRAK